MVINCVAYGCNSVQKSGDKSISFHRFPLNRPDVLAKWVLAVGRENWQPSKYARLCSMHFIESSYQIRPGAEVKYLREDAIPTLFHLQRTCNSKKSAHRNLVTIDLDKNSSEVNQPQPNAASPDIVEPSLPSMEQENVTKSALRRKVRILQAKLRRRNHKISRMKDLINNLKQRLQSSNNFNKNATIYIRVKKIENQIK